MNKYLKVAGFFILMLMLHVPASAKMSAGIFSKLFHKSFSFKQSPAKITSDTTTYAQSEKRLAKYDGQFRTNKHTGDWVKANDVIGEIYYGGIWNRQFAKTNGRISYILTNGAIATQNKTSLCAIVTTDDRNTLSLIAPL